MEKESKSWDEDEREKQKKNQHENKLLRSGAKTWSGWFLESKESETGHKENDDRSNRDRRKWQEVEVLPPFRNSSMVSEWVRDEDQDEGL